VVWNKENHAFETDIFQMPIRDVYLSNWICDLGVQEVSVPEIQIWELSAQK
jgi:hypothetical protein